jgi:hypothetical protein
VVVIDGQLVGGWRRTTDKNTAIVKLNVVTRLTKAEARAVASAAEAYGAFIDTPVEVRW